MNPLSELMGLGATSPVPTVSKHFATVVSIAPLRVRVDGDTEPLDGQPISLVPGLVDGDRVRVEIDRRQLIIIGKIHAY